MVKLGIVAFANDSGLGNQTRRLVEMLKPERILVVDSSGFSKNKTQNLHWYDNFQGYIVNGFPTNREIDVFLKGLTHVLCCENPLNFHLFSEATRLGIKTYVQSNYEFCDNLQKNLPLPTKFLMPSYWKIDEMKAKFGEDRVVYLPPPINPNEFRRVRDLNLIHTLPHRLLHVVGTLATHDRNGTLSILAALPHSVGEYSLTIRSQHPLPDNYITSDHRVSYRIGNEPNVEEIYREYDALILPRRYGGLCLTMNEALMAGMPVIMTDIEPNNKILPKEWLCKALKSSSFMARVPIDVYDADVKDLANKIDWIATDDCEHLKTQAFTIGYTNFSDSQLIDSYNTLWSQ